MRLGLTRSTGHLKRIIVLFVLAVLIAFAFYTAFYNMRPAFMDYARTYANNTANTVLNEAVKTAYQGNDYENFSVIKDNGGITAVETDTVRVNRLKADITQSIQDDIAARQSDIIYIPIGSVTSFYFLAGLGPKIPIRICPVGIVNTDFREEFDSAGINQVKHRLYLDVEIQVSFIGLTFAENETIKTSALITETVIVGETPTYYGSGNVAASMPQERISE